MVDEFIKLLEAISKHGYWPAMVTVFILIVITVLGVMIAKKASGASVDEPGDGWFGKLFKKWTNKKIKKAESVLHKYGRVNSSSFRDKLVRQHMYDFIHDHRWAANEAPARIMLFKYHNGGNFQNGEPMAKMSLHIQVMNRDRFLGEVAGEEMVRGLFRIDFPLLCDKFTKENRFYIANVKDIKHDDPRLYELATRASLSTLFIQQLYDRWKVPDGFLVVGFDEEPGNKEAITRYVEEFGRALSSTFNIPVDQLNKMFEESMVK